MGAESICDAREPDSTRLIKSRDNWDLLRISRSMDPPSRGAGPAILRIIIIIIIIFILIERNVLEV